MSNDMSKVIEQRRLEEELLSSKNNNTTKVNPNQHQQTQRQVQESRPVAKSIYRDLDDEEEVYEVRQYAPMSNGSNPVFNRPSIRPVPNVPGNGRAGVSPEAQRQLDEIEWQREEIRKARELENQRTRQIQQQQGRGNTQKNQSKPTVKNRVVYKYNEQQPRGYYTFGDWSWKLIKWGDLWSNLFGLIISSLIWVGCLFCFAAGVSGFGFLSSIEWWHYVLAGVFYFLLSRYESHNFVHVFYMLKYEKKKIPVWLVVVSLDISGIMYGANQSLVGKKVFGIQVENGWFTQILIFIGSTASAIGAEIYIRYFWFEVMKSLRLYEEYQYV